MCPVSRMVATTTVAITMTAMPSIFPMRSTSSWSGVRGSTVRPRRPATLPISVAMPVAVTTARPRPRVTAVPWKTMFSRSPSAVGAWSVATSLRTASLSPVSEASATVSDDASSSRPSALTAAPSASTRMSPGTTSVAGTRCCRPSRTTAALGAAIRRSAATACSARASWKKPSSALRMMMPRMTIASNGIPACPRRAMRGVTPPLRRSAGRRVGRPPAPAAVATPGPGRRCRAHWAPTARGAAAPRQPSGRPGRPCRVRRRRRWRPDARDARRGHVARSRRPDGRPSAHSTPATAACPAPRTFGKLLPGFAAEVRLAALLAAAVVERQHPFAQPDRLGRHLDQLVDRDHLDGRLERDGRRRRQAQ